MLRICRSLPQVGLWSEDKYHSYSKSTVSLGSLHLRYRSRWIEAECSSQLSSAWSFSFLWFGTLQFDISSTSHQCWGRPLSVFCSWASQWGAAFKVCFVSFRCASRLCYGSAAPRSGGGGTSRWLQSSTRRQWCSKLSQKAEQLWRCSRLNQWQ